MLVKGGAGVTTLQAIKQFGPAVPNLEVGPLKGSRDQSDGL